MFFVHQLRRILPFQRAAHRCRLLSSPIRRLVLGLIQFVVKGIINYPCSRRWESNLHPSALLSHWLLPSPVCGTKRWNRTTDIRDMSPLFCRLNYLGICIRAPHVSIEAVPVCPNWIGCLTDFSYTCPSLRRNWLMKAILRKKGNSSRLPATHLCLIFILLVRAFVRLVASTALGLLHPMRPNWRWDLPTWYISTIWRNYLFHLTYILYHRFYIFANYFYLWFLICSKTAFS